ncbi:MAG: hypothetical protein AB1696_11440 [Planctomycetota bacterium]
MKNHLSWLIFACVFALAVSCIGQSRQRLCGECFAPGDARWKYCTRCGGVLVVLSSPEPRPPRMLSGTKKYDLRYKMQQGEQLVVRVNSIAEFTGRVPALPLPEKRQMDVDWNQTVTEMTSEGFRFATTARLRNLLEDKKDVTADHAERFAKMKVSGYATDKGAVAAGSVAAEGIERAEDIIAETISLLPKATVAQKDAWEATGFLMAGGCNALLPEEFCASTARASGRFVLADLVVRRKEKCARIVGHFTIHATKQKKVGEKEINLNTKAEFEYVLYFAVFEGYVVEVEATGYLTSAVISDAGTATVSGKLRYWGQTKRETRTP